MAEYDVAVIGAGASGLAAAISAREKGDRVLLVEGRDQPGAKIMASGNGRCNLMNLNPPVYYGDTDFAGNVLKYLPPPELIRFFHRYGLQLRLEEGGRMYPCTFQSSSVVLALKNALNYYSCGWIAGQRILRAERADNAFRIFSESGESYEAERLIIACGGAAQPRLGGSRTGYEILASFGHTIVPVRPALTRILTDRRSISGLTGIRIRCRVRILDDEKEIHAETGELLFTETGISGICAMQCSRFVTPGTSVCEVDPLYDLFPDLEALTEWLLERRRYADSQDPTALLTGLFLPRLAYAVCKQAGLAMKGEKAGSLTEKQIRSLARAAKHYRIRILDTEGFDAAQVTAGGADCREFDPGTMASRIVKRLHAAGEVLNVDGDCGGYNLMFAFTSGILAGRNGRETEC